MAKIKRILLECTHTFENDINTGIQRVVRNIVKESNRLAKEFDLEIVPTVVKYGYFWKVVKKNRFAVYRAACIAWLKKLYGKIRPVVMKLSPSGNLERMVFLTVQFTGGFLVNALFFPYFWWTDGKKKFVPCKGDLILLLDSSWVYPIWPAVRKAKAKGAIVGLVVYDLIQITHCQFFAKAMTERFVNWFEAAVAEVDFFMAISKSVRDEIQKYISAGCPNHRLIGHADFFKLGSVMDGGSSVKEMAQRELVDIFETRDNSFYLTVGTIEPRKNHNYLLEVFELIWQKSPEVGLCIVGKVGWQCEDFVQKVKSHSLYGKSLYMFNDLSDAGLDYCYRHAKSLIFPSHAEGFGLPIVEALYKGLPVLASDIPIFREVGKDFCTYFDQMNPVSLANIICKIEKEGKMPEVRRPEQYQLSDWADSCRELITKSLALSQK